MDVNVDVEPKNTAFRENDEYTVTYARVTS